ncbi:MAG: hypothetical protein U1D30_15725 [Planctomycetota bacterium]
MNVLFVTSFNPRLYEATGYRLVDSFLDISSGRLLVCKEGDVDLPASDRILVHDLDEDVLLQKWLRENRDVIPVDMGGLAESCRCWKWFKHRRRCPFSSSWNRRASGWFRKIVSLTRGRAIPGVDVLIWLDCDCVFKKDLSSAAIEDLFQGTSVIYLKGPNRHYEETGFVGYDLRKRGNEFIEKLLDRYVSRCYLRDIRWDDAYQFHMVRDKSRIPCRDIAGTTSLFNGSPEAVFPESLIGPYFDHFKGQHARVLKMFKKV